MTIKKQYGKEVWNLWNHLQKTEGVCTLEEVVAGIVELRRLHVLMDEAVLEVYVWSDPTPALPKGEGASVSQVRASLGVTPSLKPMEFRHDFYEVYYLPENDRVRYTIHPKARKEILKRLLELNPKIHAEEVVAGLWKKKAKGKANYEIKMDSEVVGEPEMEFE